MIDRRSLLLAAAAASAPAVIRAQADTGRPFAAAVARFASFPQAHALVIGTAGAVVRAEAVRGPAPDRAVNVKSASKTVVAALTGIAIREGRLPGVEATIGAVAPGLIPAGAATGVAEITVAHLLSMRAGLERTSGANYGGWVSSRDWVADALGRPFVDRPGGGMLYSTGSTHVLGAILAETSGQSLLALAREGLGRPLGIEIPAWTRDPQGRYLGGNEMALSPLALWRLGELYRRDGLWDGARILPEGWVAASWTPVTRSRWSGDGYGFGFFLTRMRGEFVAYGRGYGGQMVWVIPSRATTVVATSDPTQPARSGGYAGDLHRMVAETILPETPRA